MIIENINRTFKTQKGCYYYVIPSGFKIIYLFKFYNHFIPSGLICKIKTRFRTLLFLIFIRINVSGELPRKYNPITYPREHRRHKHIHRIMHMLHQYKNSYKHCCQQEAVF